MCGAEGRAASSTVAAPAANLRGGKRSQAFASVRKRDSNRAIEIKECIWQKERSDVNAQALILRGGNERRIADLALRPLHRVRLATPGATVREDDDVVLAQHAERDAFDGVVHLSKRWVTRRRRKRRGKEKEQKGEHKQQEQEQRSKQKT